MGDTISRQVAIDAVDKSRRLNYHQDKKMARAHEYEHRHFLKILGDLPSAQSKQKKGKWIHVGFMTEECSECHKQYHELEYNKFCPNCGAWMGGENDETD